MMLLRFHHQLFEVNSSGKTSLFKNSMAGIKEHIMSEADDVGLQMIFVHFHVSCLQEMLLAISVFMIFVRKLVILLPVLPLFLLYGA